MEVKAVEKFIRISPKKARPVADLVRGQKAMESLTLLRFTPKKGAKIIYKAVKSAVSNAENNFSLKSDDLIIKSISIDGGPSLKRFRPVSKGMGHRILKRTSHITVVVSDQKTTSKTSKKATVAKPQPKVEEKKVTTEEETHKMEIEKPEFVKKDKAAPRVDVKNTMFRRKTG